MDDIIVGISQHLDEFETNVCRNSIDKYDMDSSKALRYLVEKSIMSPKEFKTANPQRILATICKVNFNRDTVITSGTDAVFAIQSKYPETLLCKLIIGGLFFHELTLVPNSIEWILNGCPIILIWLAYHEVKLELYTLDKTKIHTNDICIYGMLLDSNERIILAQNPSSHKFPFRPPLSPVSHRNGT